MKRLLVLGTSVTTMFLFGCSSSKMVLMPDYQTLLPKAETMQIISTKGDPTDHYEGSVKDEFGEGDQGQLIAEFFRKQLIKDIKNETVVKSVTILDRALDFPRGEEMTVDAGTSGSRTIKLMPADYHFTLEGAEPDLVLVLDGVDIGTELSTTNSGAMMGTGGVMIGGGSSKKELYYKAKVILWDNIKNKVISYGYVNTSSTSSFIPVITMSNWLEVSRKFVNEVFTGSRLKRTTSAR